MFFYTRVSHALYVIRAAGKDYLLERLYYLLPRIIAFDIYQLLAFTELQNSAMSVDFETAAKQEVAYLSAVHPTPDDIPSCLSILDEFLRCNGMQRILLNSAIEYQRLAVLGSQLRTIYRYGHAAQCSSKFDEFKFCLSLKALPAEEKRAEWIRRRAEWWALRRLTRSSEDVWDMRA